MLLKLTHTTDLAYSDLISESVMELRMAPRQEQDQHRLSFTLGDRARRRPALSYFDWLGNTVHAFTVNAFHRQIRIVATSVVETERSRGPTRTRCPTPGRCRRRRTTTRATTTSSSAGPIVDSPASCAARRRSSAPKRARRLGELAWRMLGLINDALRLPQGHHHRRQPDHRHARARLRRLPGLHPPDDRPRPRAAASPRATSAACSTPTPSRFRGFTQTHAWCELLFPSYGWVGFDPANNCPVGENFVKVAVGRDYRDVPPNKGVYRGKAKETIEVAGPQRRARRPSPPSWPPSASRRCDIPAFPAGSRRPPRDGQPAAGSATAGTAAAVAIRSAGIESGPSGTPERPGSRAHRRTRLSASVTGARQEIDRFVHGCGLVSHFTSSVHTRNFSSFVGPKLVVSATSTASRPWACLIRPMRCDVVAGVHAPTTVAEVDLEVRAEVHRGGVERDADVAEVARRVAGGDVEGAEHRDRQVHVVAADALLFARRRRTRSWSGWRTGSRR